MEKPRIVFLNGDITGDSAMEVILQLLDFEREDDTKEISLYINSNGGSISSGLAIYDTINNLKSPVSTVCYGMAASMGAFLLSCGKKGLRYALPHSRILIHQPLICTENGFYRPQTAIKRLADDLAKQRMDLEDIMANNMGRTAKEIHAACERDNWLSTEEALAIGIIDEIITSIN